MKITEVKQDLFTVDPKYTLVHCISADCVMGAGIAKDFRNLYPNMPYNIQKNHPLVGTASYYLADNIHDVINLITKRLYHHKPTYDCLEDALQDMRRFVTAYHINYLAMPYIGCGLDRLQWDKVLPIIRRVFMDMDVEILVCGL